MQLSWLKSQRSRKELRASPKLHALSRPSPFDIPEVLVQVFAYLDENTLRNYGGEGNALCTSPIMRTMVKLQAKHEQLLERDGIAISMFRPLRELDVHNILLPTDMTTHVLQISKPGVIVIDGPWVPANHDRQRPFRLQALVIKNAKMQQAKLKLLSLAKRDGQLSYSHVTQSGDGQYDWAHLFEHLKNLPITLRAFQFSVHSQTHPTRIEPMEEYEVRQRTIDVCRKASEWFLLPAEVTPGLIQELVLLPNTIATLEIVTEGAWCQGFNSKDAESTRYDDLDLGGDRMWGDQDIARTMLGKRKVWTCRHLETLQVQIHAHSTRLVWPVHSRTIFGYISAVCPKLQELSIYAPSHCSYNWSAHVYQPKLFLQLDSGLCFLSKLDRLRKLKVIYGDEESRGIGSQEYELNWISPSGHRAKDSTRRMVTMANRSSQLEAEETLERRFSPQTKSSLTIGEDLADQLRNLGLLSEVKRVVEEMDRSDRRCLPLLEKVSFHDAVIERRPDTALIPK
ncbi:hypothetical protein BGZ97_001891 [Linnemannia gamsii]|uniref:Uncharacterized protein n=1 Tax=Linnemannia gamsii TaxID=64522 RepID=A0A9P6RP72_9FUNG|nr:hypothetical protein BGZ97_001891 [Linnemannia gamsii]